MHRFNNLFCLLLVKIGAIIAGVDPDVNLRLPTSSLTPRKCWVFSHMNKAGGTSVKTMLLEDADRQKTSYKCYNERWYRQGKTVATEFLDSAPTIVVGGYTEGLRGQENLQNCKWFTMVRQ